MIPLSRLAAALLAGLCGVSWPGQEKPPPRSKEEALKLFASEFVPLTPGQGKFPASFVMGSDATTSPASEQPAVKVTLSAPFAMARYEVTQELYLAVMGKNPARWPGPRNSVEMVSWEEANTFCTRATQELRKRELIGKDEEIRLPSEAEWEYACRAGTTTNYSFGNGAGSLKDHAWYRDNSRGEDPPVGKKKPNPWGLYDVHGYIWEWCADSWHPSHAGASPHGKARVKEGEKGKVLRGGSWADPADSCRSAYRTHQPLDYRSDKVGFRCVRAHTEGQP
jgi:formylglycine-generating enzyme required for sulfatase activity